jgi:ribosomal protein S18 acetylase RimI-like enzyme
MASSLLWFLVLLPFVCQAWLGRPSVLHVTMAASWRFHHANTPKKPGALCAGVDIVPVGCDEDSINKAAAFMVEAFWLGTKRQMVESNGNADDDEISNDARSRLVKDQALDLNDKYGERMGNRILPSLLLQAVDDNGDTVGLVGLEVSLLDRSKPNILSPKVAEEMLKSAVASLGPKQRRQYKDSPASQLAQELLSNVQAVCSLCNLAISPTARRRGIAMELCKFAETVVQEELDGYDSIFLNVESDNDAARRLYEEKLGYKHEYTIDSATALRADPKAGSFIETQKGALILSKVLL